MKARRKEMAERDGMLQTWNKTLIQKIAASHEPGVAQKKGIVFPRLVPLHVFTTSFDCFVFVLDRVNVSSRRIFRFPTPPQKIWAK